MKPEKCSYCDGPTAVKLPRSARTRGGGTATRLEEGTVRLLMRVKLDTKRTIYGEVTKLICRRCAPTKMREVFDEVFPLLRDPAPFPAQIDEPKKKRRRRRRRPPTQVVSLDLDTSPELLGIIQQLSQPSNIAALGHAAERSAEVMQAFVGDFSMALGPVLDRMVGHIGMRRLPAETDYDFRQRAIEGASRLRWLSIDPGITTVLENLNVQPTSDNRSGAARPRRPARRGDPQPPRPAR